MSQTFCKMEVFPAFALPMMSTLNWIFGTRGPGGSTDIAEDDAEAGDGEDRAGTGARGRAGDGAGAGAGGDGSRAAAGVGAEAEAEDIAGDDDAGAGDGGGDGTRQHALCLTPIARKCCEKKEWARYVDHSSESGSVIIQYELSADSLVCGGDAVSFHGINSTFRNPRTKSDARRS